MVALEYLLWLSIGLAVLWSMARIDDYLIAREQRQKSSSEQ